MADEQKKDWALSEPRVSKGPQHWEVDVIRVEDEQIVMTLSLNPESLPPRFKEEKGKKKGKKTQVWALPASGTKLTLGFHETERVIALFREKRKQAKKERASQQKRIEDLFPAGRRLARCCKKWFLRGAFHAFARRCREPIRYSNQALLRLRPAPAAMAMALAASATTSFSSAAAPGSISSSRHHRLADIPLELRRTAAVCVGGGGSFSRTPGAPPRSAPAVGAPPGLTPPQPHLSPPPAPPASAPFAPPALPLNPTTATMVDARFLEESAILGSALAEKERWKRQWKEQFLSRLEMLAEKAWQQEFGGDAATK